MTSVNQLQESLNGKLRELVSINQQRKRLWTWKDNEYVPTNVKALVDLDRTKAFLLIGIGRDIKTVWKELVGGFLHHPSILALIKDDRTPEVAYLHRCAILIEEFYQSGKTVGGGFHALLDLSRGLQRQARMTTSAEIISSEHAIHATANSMYGYLGRYYNDFRALVRRESPELLELGVLTNYDETRDYVSDIVATYVAFLAGVRKIAGEQADATETKSKLLDDESVYARLREECRALALPKKIDILQPGLLIHGTGQRGEYDRQGQRGVYEPSRRPSEYTEHDGKYRNPAVESIRNFIAQGIRPVEMPEDALTRTKDSYGKEHKAIVPAAYGGEFGSRKATSQLSFFSITLKRTTTFAKDTFPGNWNHPIIFILNPAVLDKHNTHSFMTDKQVVERCREEIEEERLFRAMVQKKNIYLEEEYELQNLIAEYIPLVGQILCPYPIKFTDVIGIVVMDTRLLDKNRDRMNSYIRPPLSFTRIFERALRETDKHFAVPIYDPEGNVLWP